MPERPWIDPGLYDPAKHKNQGKSAVVAAKTTAREDVSKTVVHTEMRIWGTSEVMSFPVIVATTVWDIKLLLADRLGMEATGTMAFVTKQGCYWREQLDHEEIRRKVWVRGITSFQRPRAEYPHPIAIIGCGHIGLRQAMIFMKAKEFNFVLFDKKPKVGGISWWDQANTTSKLQTELGVYHMNYDETLPPPANDYPWPSRDELLAHFQWAAEEYGILPYCRLSTCVKQLDSSGFDAYSQRVMNKWDTKYELTIETDGSHDGEYKLMSSAVLLYPGNLSIPRRETYKGEEEFGGLIGYGMFNELDYGGLSGKNVAIIGHGAFAVENVRTCMEYNAGKLYLVCRRKNIAVPRFVSWLANQSLSPISAALLLDAADPMYKLAGFDQWSYYAVQANAARTTCSIQQKVRFGIGDVYFLAISWGKLEVIEDKSGVKRLSPGALHCGNGRRIEVEAVLKLLGFVGNFENDRLMRVKEMHGFWVNNDPKRYLVAEPISVMASKFGGTSFSPGAIAWAEFGMWFLHYPLDYFQKISESALIPRHKAEGDDRPAYVVDARHGTQTMIMVGAVIPWLAERGAIEAQLKHSRMHLLHPIEKYLQYCKEDWDHYCAKLRLQGLAGPEFPYTLEVGHKYIADYEAEHQKAQSQAEEAVSS